MSNHPINDAMLKHLSETREDRAWYLENVIVPGWKRMTQKARERGGVILPAFSLSEPFSSAFCLSQALYYAKRARGIRLGLIP